VLAGARYTNLDTDVRLRDNTIGVSVSSDGSKNWWDPMIGARYTHDFGDKWSVAVRGDVGGTGTQSDFVWDGFATVGYKVGDSGKIYAGYRILDYNYKDGDPADRFTFNIRINGPVIGYGMTF
jgi:hypothetical protein